MKYSTKLPRGSLIVYIIPFIVLPVIMYPKRRYKQLINPVMANIIATANEVGNAEMVSVHLNFQ